MENDTLDGWVEKYKHYSGYPIIGKVCTHPSLHPPLVSLDPVPRLVPGQCCSLIRLCSLVGSMGATRR